MTGPVMKVLVIEDSDADFLLTERYLAEHIPAARCTRVVSWAGLEAALRAEDWSVILSDYSVPGMDFLQSKDLVQSLRPDVPVILISGSLGEEQAVELIKQGVWDFVIKDNMVRLESAVKRALAEAEVHRARKAAEAGLRASEQNYRMLFDSIPQSIFTKDLDSVYTTCNQNFARDLGVRPKELLGHTDLDFFPRELAEKYRADDRRIMGSGQKEIIEERFERAGRMSWVRAIKTPIRNDEGLVVGILGIFSDITQSRKAAQKLQEQAALLDTTMDAIFVLDMARKIIYWNKGAERVYGWGAAEAMGKDPNALLGTNAPIEMHAYETVVKEGEWMGEIQRKTRDGRDVTIQARWTLLRDQQREPRGILAVNTDVTEWRSVQKQLLRAQRLESLGTLAGGIAHDLNNILSPIIMGVEALSLQHADADSRRILDIIRMAAQRGANIVRQVLSFARGIEGERAEVQLTHIVREIVQLIRETFPKAIEIRFQIPRDLPPAFGNATQLHQVIMNLCVNARDAMPDGGILTLSAESVKLDEAYARRHIEARPIRYVALKVEDSGSGMTPETAEKIFDPFFTTKDPGKGTGLGLSTVLTIVKGHGGFINVYSEVGKGSSFTIYLPAADQGEADKAEKVPEGLPMGAGELILVADDEAAVREITRQVLESYGYRVLTANDGTEAVELYRQKHEEIHLVFTDMMMPRMDGPSTIRALREIDPDVKIICTSGLATAGEGDDVAGLRVNAFLQKPYVAESLLVTLRNVLGRQ